MGRVLLAGMAGWLAVAAGVRAADAESTKPYDYRIILRVAPHALLTDTFRRQLRDEIQDDVQAALGPLAQVEVQDAASAWLDPATLDAHTETGPAKRHFVEVFFADGKYVVRARQHDGSTGLASPVVREVRTADRAFVGRLITQFIDQDFGAVGTVVGYDRATDRAELALRGGRLAQGEWARLVPAGSVFALTRVEGSPPRGRPVDSGYLITLAEPKDGRVECRFVYRFSDQLADWSALTIRALRLGTASAPVRLRVVDRNGLPPPGLQVRVSPDGFRPTDAVRDQGTVRNAAFETAHAYDRVAFVLVTSGDQKVAQVPVPVIDDRLTVVRLTALAAGGEAREQLELDARNAHQRWLDIVRRLQEQNSKLKSAADAKQHQQALDDVKRNVDLLDRELATLSAEMTRLRRAAAQVQSPVGPILDQCDVFAKEVRKRRESLLRSQDDLEQALKDEKNQEPEKQNYLALLQKAKAQREEADFDAAIETYTDILNRFGEREDVRKELDDLTDKWKIKGPDHKAARTFVYGAWTRMKTAEDVRTNLPKAREALEACKQAGDRLTPQKLLHASTGPVDLLEKEFEQLKNGESDSDKINLKQVQKLIEDLQAFLKDVSAYVRPDEKK